MVVRSCLLTAAGASLLLVGGALTGAVSPAGAAAAPPVVTKVAPFGVPTGGGRITVTGRSFTGATAVYAGGIPSGNFKVVSATKVVATVGRYGDPGLAHVQVVTPAGSSALGRSDVFEFFDPPSVTAISRTTGPASGGGSITITGDEFADITSVQFGAVRATSFSVTSRNSITASVPAGTGLVDVTVVGKYGTSDPADADHYLYGGPTLTAAAVLPGKTSDTGVSDLACPAAGTCFAVGSYGYAHSGFLTPVLSKLSDGVWTPIQVPVPSGHRYAELRSIDCPSTTVCAAVGRVIDSPYGQPVPEFAEVLRNGVWSQVELPAGVNLHEITCSTTGVCVAGGGADTDESGVTNGDTHFVTLTTTASGTTVREVDGVSIAGADNADIDGITCPSITSCVAWGEVHRTDDNYYLRQAFAEQLSGGVWSGGPLAAPADVTDPVVASDIQTVRCTAPGSCVGYGNYGLDGGTDASGYPSPTWFQTKAVLSGGNVTVTQLPINDDGTGYPGGHSVGPIACTSTTVCVGVSDSTPSFTQTNYSFYDTLTADGWQAKGFVARPYHNGVHLDAVACSGGTTCVAGGTRLFQTSSEEFPVGGAPVAILPTSTGPGQVDLPGPPGGVVGEVSATGVSACAPASSFCVQIATGETDSRGGHFDYAVTIAG